MSLVLSLFPGIGLLDMAFESEGFCVTRGPDVLWGGDIRRFHPPAGRFDGVIGRFDGVIGGPPCQAFSSLAHLVRANGCEPKFGNLIPEFERCAREAEPQWFLMENVQQAPEPNIQGYAVKSFLLNNACLLGADGLGQEQERVRRFSFGVIGGGAPDLRRWIDFAVLMLPAVRHNECLTGGHDRPPSARRRRKAVLSSNHPVPFKIGGSGKRKSTVTSSDGGPSVRMSRYSFAEACRLQGLPEDFLADAPFRADAKLKAVANGVPLPMGRAIAKAVREAYG